MTRRRSFTLFAALSFALAGLQSLARPAETLPAQLSDSEYWKMISDFSEPSGHFQYDIVTSNEVSYQHVMPELMKTPRSGGAYLGVGPEQNFTYHRCAASKNRLHLRHPARHFSFIHVRFRPHAAGCCFTDSGLGIYAQRYSSSVTFSIHSTALPLSCSTIAI